MADSQNESTAQSTNNAVVQEKATVEAPKHEAQQPVEKTNAEVMFGEAKKEEVAQATQVDAQAKTEQPVKQEAKDEAQVLTLPKDSLLDKARIGEILKEAKEKNLTISQAQELLDREHGVLQKYHDNQQAKFEEVSSKWIDQLKADPDFSGDNFSKNAEIAHRAAKEFAPPELLAWFEKTGYGNNPLVVKLFYNIGKLSAEDKMISGGKTTNTQEKTRAQILFGS